MHTQYTRHFEYFMKFKNRLDLYFIFHLAGNFIKVNGLLLSV